MMPSAELYGLGLEPGENRLVPYDPLWPRAFEEEVTRLNSVLGTTALGIEHIGSTAVPGLAAKPIIDIAIGVARIDDGLAMRAPLAALGYDYAGAQGIADHHIFGRSRARTHLVHVTEFDGPQWRAYVRFRERLRSDSDARAAYEHLKLSLAAGSCSRAEYTAGKTAFVERLSA